MPPATPAIMRSVVERVSRLGGGSGWGIVGWASVMAVNLAHTPPGDHRESP